MRTYQVTKREGELLGQIDWSHDFAQHYSCRSGPASRIAEAMTRDIENLWQVERLHLKGKLLRVREGEYWHNVIAVGMYDGWPYWKPVPAVLIAGPIGSEWRHFPCVDEFKMQHP